MELDWDAEANDDEEFEGPDAYLEDIDEEQEMDLELDVEEAEERNSARASFEEIINGLVNIQRIPHIGPDGATFRLSLDGFTRLLNVVTHPSSQSRGATSDGAEETNEDSDDDYYPSRNRYRESKKWHEEIKEPKKVGLELLMGGEFGRVGLKSRSRAGNSNLARILRDRRENPRVTPKEELSADLIPNSYGTAVASYPANIYCGQFSLDSSFYYTCCQDFTLHIYDMTKPPVPRTQTTIRQGYRHAIRRDLDVGHETTMKVLKSIRGLSGGWTVTDSHLSPDNERIIYATRTATVHMAKTLDSEPSQVPIRFSDPGRPASRGWTWGIDDDDYGIWSCRFSADGNEIIAGGRGKIFVYDLLADRRTVKINAHQDDVNSCCWADTSSGNVLISASDDTFLKVWDRRSLGASTKPSGVLIGHTEGITYVSAKGDGRYVISNGKDQTLRLWDLRKMRTSADHESVQHMDYGIPNYDYRRGRYYKPRYMAHPDDCSIMQYTGHAVLRTLIRCHFSPAETTGSSYLYSGSYDGKIHIWSLDGRVVQVLDRAYTLPMTADPSAPQPEDVVPSQGYPICVRDVSWHTQAPVLMSAGWEGSQGESTVARHEWKGLNKMGGRLEDYVAKERAEHAERQAREERTPLRRSARLRNSLPGTFMVDNGEDDEDDEDDDDYEG